LKRRKKKQSSAGGVKWKSKRMKIIMVVKNLRGCKISLKMKTQGLKTLAEILSAINFKYCISFREDTWSIVSNRTWTIWNILTFIKGFQWSGMTREVWQSFFKPLRTLERVLILLTISSRSRSDRCLSDSQNVAENPWDLFLSDRLRDCGLKLFPPHTLRRSDPGPLDMIFMFIQFFPSDFQSLDLRSRKYVLSSDNK
jgi:hypothetical protein